MWEPIQDELRARHTGASGTVDNQPNALLHGLLFCHLCDRPMAHTYTAAHGRRYRYYVCRRSISPVPLECKWILPGTDDGESSAMERKWACPRIRSGRLILR